MTKFRPMLAARTPTEAELRDLHYPMLASYKLDGIRALVKDGVVLSRTLKPIPSAFVQETFRSFEGLDGELIAGDPADPSVYHRTYSSVMTHGCTEPVYFFAFDVHDTDSDNYYERLERIDAIEAKNSHLYILGQRRVDSYEEVIEVEAAALSVGYEGLILRYPYAPYKFGRSTLKEQALIKLKRVQDGEAVIIGVEELKHNNNEALKDALGLTKRSSHKTNKTSSGVMGSLLVRDLVTGVVFNVGTGFTAQDRDVFWAQREFHVRRGTIIKYKHLNYGVKDLPRHPVYLGLRHCIDL